MSTLLLRLPTFTTNQIKYISKLSSTTPQFLASFLPASTAALTTTTTTTTTLQNKYFSTSQKCYTNIKSLFSDANWTTLYRLPIIRIVAAFHRLKVHQAILTTIGTPLAFGLEYGTEYIDAPLGIIVASIGVTGLITLCLASYAFQDLIGFIYINKTGDKLKIAYVDFWGRRKHAFVRVEDLIPDAEIIKKNRFQFYQPICLYSDNKFKLKLIQRFGIIESPLTFIELFGE